MRRKLEVTPLRKIVAIRKLQHTAAEAAAMQAVALLTRKSALERQAATGHESAQRHWESLHEQAVMPLELTMLWSDQVRLETALVEKAKVEAESARAANDRCMQEFQIMEQRKRLAGETLASALYERAQLRDEAAIQEASDRHLRNEGLPCG